MTSAADLNSASSSAFDPARTLEDVSVIDFMTPMTHQHFDHFAGDQQQTPSWTEPEAIERPKIPHHWASYSGSVSYDRQPVSLDSDMYQMGTHAVIPDLSAWAIPTKPASMVPGQPALQSFQPPVCFPSENSNIVRSSRKRRLSSSYPSGPSSELDLAFENIASETVSSGRIIALPDDFQSFDDELDTSNTLQTSGYEQQSYITPRPVDARRRSASSVTHLSDVPSLEEYTGNSDADNTRHHTPAAEGLAQVLSTCPPQSSPQWSRPRACGMRKPSPSPRRFSKGVHEAPRVKSRSSSVVFSSSTPPAQTSPYTPVSTKDLSLAHSTRFYGPSTPMSMPTMTPPSFSAQRDMKPQPLVLSQTYDFGPQLSADMYFGQDHMGSFVTPPMTSMSLPTPFHDGHMYHQQPMHTAPSMPSDAPNLFASAKQDQLPPPVQDMLTTDPNLIPREQDLRTESDLYTPRWVRGQGHKREGWCGMCRPGRWLILKNSAYWYDKSFSHGICASTGDLFAAPESFRRSADNHEIWEGFCGNCDQWISLINSKRTGTSWFRHVAKCHSNSKDNGSSNKRRRMSGNFKSIAAPQKPDFMTSQPIAASTASHLASTFQTHMRHPSIATSLAGSL